MPPRDSQAEHLLFGLGFTALEAAVYRCLVEASPATGYRVAQQIGKPIANTYKALESLAAKGAVLIDEGEHRRCRAVPPNELLRRLERAFHERCTAAESALLRLAETADDDRVYQLKSRDQVFERARSMIDSAQSVVLADLFPAPASELAENLERAAARGVRVGCLVYEETSLTGVRTVRCGPAAWLPRWPGEQVVVVVDALQHLVAVVERDGPGVVQALWSPSVLLSFTQHDGLMSQLIAHCLDDSLRQGASMEALARDRESLRPLSVINAPGFEKLTGQTHEQPGFAAGNRTLRANSGRTASAESADIADQGDPGS
jgi:sugar-specific transcriptional regulator TrmB